MGKSKTLESSHIRFGNRTYFFDVKSTKENKKYMRITESQFKGEGKERQYNSFILFPENLSEFQKELTRMILSVNLSR